MSLYFLTPIWSFNMALCKIHMATTGLLPSLQNVNRRNTAAVWQHNYQDIF